jgi:hypothetical protein
MTAQLSTTAGKYKEDELRSAISDQPSAKQKNPEDFAQLLTRARILKTRRDLF